MRGQAGRNQQLAEPAWDALEEAVAGFYWRKRDLESFLRAELRDHPEILGSLDFNGTKRNVAGELIDMLRRDESRYQGLTIDLLVRLSKFDPTFPRLSREENAETLMSNAQSALRAVVEVIGTYSAQAQERERIQADLEAEARRTS